MAKSRGPADGTSLLEGRVEILAYNKGVLFDRQVLWNIVLSQGLAEVMRGMSSSPYTTPTNTLAPRVITRMAIGDQGTSPSDSTLAKVPVKTMSALYHETYRQDIDSGAQTLYSPTGFTVTGDTSTTAGTPAGTLIQNMDSVFGITVGLAITGSGIPANTVVSSVVSSDSITISNPATLNGTGTTFTIVGALNLCEFVTTFNATDVNISAFTNPSNPVVNEVGLVIINPNISPGYARAPVTSPVAPSTDEVLLSIRTFKSVPFAAANDISVTIRYTLYIQ